MTDEKIIKAPKFRHLPFTQVANNFINNPALTGTAKWLMTYILSKPPRWKIKEQDIRNHCKNTRGEIKKAIQELISNGYLVRKGRYRDKMGRLQEWIYDVVENPSVVVSPEQVAAWRARKGGEKNKSKIIEWNEVRPVRSRKARKRPSADEFDDVEQWQLREDREERQEEAAWEMVTGGRKRATEKKKGVKG